MLTLLSACALGCGDDSNATGDAGSAVTGCSALGEDCDPAACCARLLCVRAEGSELDGCQLPCVDPDDCESGCCRTTPGRAMGYCAPTRFCSCGQSGADCGGFEPECCEGLACARTLSTEPREQSEDGLGSCRPRCESAQDCESGCCAELGGTGDRVCVGSEYCNPAN